MIKKIKDLKENMLLILIGDIILTVFRNFSKDIRENLIKNKSLYNKIQYIENRMFLIRLVMDIQNKISKYIEHRKYCKKKDMCWFFKEKFGVIPTECYISSDAISNLHLIEAEDITDEVIKNNIMITGKIFHIDGMIVYEDRSKILYNSNEDKKIEILDMKLKNLILLDKINKNEKVIILPEGNINFDKIEYDDKLIEKEKELIDYLSNDSLLRKTVLIYGQPGSGKTTLVNHIIKNTEKKTLIINDEETFHKTLSLINEGMIKDLLIVIEDFDKFELKHKDECSDLISSLDSTTNKEQLTVVLTTNKIKDIHRSLLRPGRIDFIYEHKLTKDKIKEYINYLNLDFSLNNNIINNICKYDFFTCAYVKEYINRISLYKDTKEFNKQCNKIFNEFIDLYKDINNIDNE